METLTTNNFSLVANEFSISWIDNFISFIDRSEKTIRTYITNLKQFAAFLSYKAIKNPNRADIIAYKTYLGTTHEAIKLNCDGSWSYRTDKANNKILVKCKPATIKLYLQSVKQFFKFLASENLYPNIAENIHAPKITTDHKKEALSASDVLTIEESIIKNAEVKAAAAKSSTKDKEGKFERATEQGKRLFAMYLLAVNAGLRTIEINRANIKDLETISGTTYIYIHGKGHAEADTKKPLAQEVVNAINEYLAARTDARRADSPLFVSTGNRSRGKRIATTTISTMLKRAMQQAGYNSERLTAHSLRHTAGTNIMEITNSNIYVTQKYMRHSNPGTTEIYLHNDTNKQEVELANKLYDRYHNKENTANKENSVISLNNLISDFTQEELSKLLVLATQVKH